MKILSRLALFSLFLVLASCSPGTPGLLVDVPDADCADTTAHGTCIEDGLDQALFGEWVLVSQSLDTPAGSIVNPFAGRTTDFGGNGEYSEDYSTESTADVSVGGLTSTCEVDGLLNGTWEVDESFVLRIVPSGDSPSVTCSAGGSSAGSNAATTPLGFGPGTGNPPYVPYSYSLNSSWSTLTIVQENSITGVTTSYLFNR